MVSIIICTMRPSFMGKIFDNYERQDLEKKQLIIVLNRDDMNIKKWNKKAEKYKNVRIYQLPEEFNLGQCLNYGIEKADYDIIAKFDDDDYYAPSYLNEAVNTLNEKSASIIGKSTAYIYFESKKALMIFRNGNEGKYRRHVKGGSLVFRKAVWNIVKFPEDIVAKSDAYFLRECSREGFKIYSVSKYNYVCVRREDTRSHTQKKSTEEYMAQCEFVCTTDDYRSIITKKFPRL
ncbi:MAG: glycosyltransferase [Paenibacillaceae bacterium]